MKKSHKKESKMDFLKYSFKKAVPVWKTGDERVVNQTLDFVCRVSDVHPLPVLALTASCSFCVFVNGKFVACGPARAAHGVFKVDEISLAPHLTAGENTVAIRVSGYNAYSFIHLKQPSFLCAEILSGDRVLAATGDEGFCCYPLTERLQKVQRYTFQRTFAETYMLGAGAFAEEQGNAVKESVCVSPVGERLMIVRDVPYGDYEELLPVSTTFGGSFGYSPKGKPARMAAARLPYQFFHLEEQTYASQEVYQSIDIKTTERVCADPAAVVLPREQYVDLDMGRNYTGMMDLDVECEGQGTLLVTFGEVYTGEDFLDARRQNACNIVALVMEKGKYHLTTSEPYGMKYVRLFAVGANMRVNNFKLIKIAYPASGIRAKFVGNDPEMKEIYDAALETFVSNTVDVYMDCPTRERTGWLCDSFFTARTEQVLTGTSLVERAFLRNFLMPERFEFLPEGMLAMCYPADHPDGKFIPNWAMWYALELREYLARTGDRLLVDEAKEKMYSLLSYFKRFENERGLLEKLESWVFVEWSMANKLVQDVSFPSNMLYAEFKLVLAALYGDAALAREGEALKETIRKMAMTPSGFFTDNAHRVDGVLVPSGERTEACQYYAFYFGIATPESHPVLWDTLVKDFGYDREKTGKYPEIYPANAFIGNYLRLDLLDRYGYREALYDNIRGYFLYMAKKTGTLWESIAPSASCNHGFASHVIYWMEHLGLVK